MTKNLLLTKAQKKFFKIALFLFLSFLILSVFFYSIYLFRLPKKIQVVEAPKETPKPVEKVPELISINPNQISLKDIFGLEYLKPNTNYTNQIIESKGNKEENNRSLTTLLSNPANLLRIVVEDSNLKNQTNYLKVDQKNIQQISLNINPNNCKKCPAIVYKVGFVQSLTNKNELIIVNIEDKKILPNRAKSITYNTNFNLLIDKNTPSPELDNLGKKVILTLAIESNSNVDQIKQILESLIIKD